jgi:hypothetical protein
MNPNIMNRILSFGLAAIMTTALTPTVFAKDDRGGGHGGGGRGGGGGGGGARVSAPAHVSGGGGGGARFSAPSHVSMSRAPQMRAQPAPRIVQQSAPRSFERTPNMQPRANTTFTPSVARNGRTRQPSVAFGGHAVTNDNATVNNNTAVNARNARTFSTNDSGRFSGRTNSRDFRVPFETSRGWDRGRVHEWNNHRFRWSGGDWVIIDPGFGYPYGYYNYDDVTPYSAVPYSYDNGMDLTMSAQDKLTRLGYSPGPIDGVMGGQTRDAIADFQNDNRLPVTGNLDTATVRALGL